MAHQDFNPYAAPTASIEWVPSRIPRVPTLPTVAIAGVVIGASAFLLALALTPTDVVSTSQFDFLLSQRVGLTFPIAIGFWIAWIRQSPTWAILAPGIGLALGLLYWVTAYEDATISVCVLPAVLGAIAAVAMGVRKSKGGRSTAFGRARKGALAGVVLGMVYLDLLGDFDLLNGSNPFPSVDQYIAAKWKVGTAAFALSSGLFFPLFHWASRLSDAVTNDAHKSSVPDKAMPPQDPYAE